MEQSENVNFSHLAYNSAITTSNGNLISTQVDVMRLNRLICESLESTFFLSNIFMEEHSITKIFDVLNEILPTAYVYDTGYWVFYGVQNEQSLCVCARFGLECRHVLNSCHCLNMETNIKDFYATDIVAKFFPLDARVRVLPVISDSLRAYDVDISLELHPLLVREVGFFIYGSQTICVDYKARYLITPPNNSLAESLMQFTPTPKSSAAYLSYFDNPGRFRFATNGAAEEMKYPTDYTIMLISSQLTTSIVHVRLQQAAPPSGPASQSTCNPLIVHCFPNSYLICHDPEEPNEEDFTTVMKGRDLGRAFAATTLFLMDHGMILRLVPRPTFQQAGLLPAENKDKTKGIYGMNIYDSGMAGGVKNNREGPIYGNPATLPQPQQADPKKGSTPTQKPAMKNVDDDKIAQKGANERETHAREGSYASKFKRIFTDCGLGQKKKAAVASTGPPKTHFKFSRQFTSDCFGKSGKYEML